MAMCLPNWPIWTGCQFLGPQFLEEEFLKEYGNTTYESLNCYLELVSESSWYSYIQSFEGFYYLWISICRKETFCLKLELHRCFSLYTKKWKGQLKVSLFLVQCFHSSFNSIYHSLLKLPCTFLFWALLVFFYSNLFKSCWHLFL